MRWFALTAVLNLALSSTGCQEGDLGSARARGEAIIGGDRATVDMDATVLLFNVGAGFSSCSGSVISPRVIITAKHCLGPDPNNPDTPLGIVALTRVSDDPELQYFVVAGQTTPGDGIERGDFAVLVVDRDIDLWGSPYYELSRDQADLRQGDQLKLTGYGLSEAGAEAGAFEKLQTFDEVDQITQELVVTLGRGACSGDSGGTVLDPEGRLAAVMVRADCAGVTLSERVDNFLYLVDWALEESGVCVPDDETCNGLDDDCDGVVDQGCAEEGDACVEDRSCAAGLSCQDDGTCAQACAPAGPLVCANDHYCDAIAPGLGLCRPGAPGAGGLGEACAADADCASLACSGGSCRIACAPNVVACPFGLACVENADLGGVCERPGHRPAGPLVLGDPCGGHAECGSGLSCGGGEDDRYCAPSCNAGCPVGFHCRGDACVRGELGEPGGTCGDDLDCGEGTSCVGNDASVLDGALVCAVGCGEGCADGFACTSGACLPALAVVGSFCEVNNDCATGLCGHFPDGDRCTERCSGADACPTGTVCVVQDDGVNLLCRTVPDPAEAGGCAAAGPGTSVNRGMAAMALLLGFALLTRRRR